MRILLTPNFISKETCAALNAWVDEGVEKKWLDAGVVPGTGWACKNRFTTRKYTSRFEYPPVVREVFDQISAKLGLHNVPTSTVGGGKDGVVVSCTFPGGSIFSHTDAMEGDNLHVLRCNIMTRDSDAGGDLYIGGNKVDVGVGDLHCYLPSAIEHYVTPVEGKTSRIMWMFGYKMSLEDFAKL
jgi:hypothetical protein